MRKNIIFGEKTIMRGAKGAGRITGQLKVSEDNGSENADEEHDQLGADERKVHGQCHL